MWQEENLFQVLESIAKVASKSTESSMKHYWNDFGFWMPLEMPRNTRNNSKT